MSAQVASPLAKKVTPANGDNAIVNVALLLEFEGPVDQMTIAVFAAQNLKLFEWGYVGKPVQGMAVSFIANESGAGVELSNQRAMAGYSYSRQLNLKTKRHIREINLRDNQLVLIADQYTRWARLWSEAQEVFELFLPHLDGKVRLSNLVLEYVDQFRSREGVQAFPTEEVLQDSKFIARNCLVSRDNWHSNHGYFAETLSSGCERRLDNIGFTLSTIDETLVLSIVSQHKYSGFSAERSLLRTVSHVFDHAHTASKVLMNQVLTDQAKELISLNAEPVSV